MPGQPWATSRCTSQQCGATIYWARTDNGKTMPVDVDPVAHGTVLLTGAGPTPRATVLPKDDRGDRTDLRTSHFATCPAARGFRKTVRTGTATRVGGP